MGISRADRCPLSVSCQWPSPASRPASPQAADTGTSSSPLPSSPEAFDSPSSRPSLAPPPPNCIDPRLALHNQDITQNSGKAQYAWSQTGKDIRSQSHSSPDHWHPIQVFFPTESIRCRPQVMDPRPALVQRRESQRGGILDRLSVRSNPVSRKRIQRGSGGVISLAGNTAGTLAAAVLEAVSVTKI